MHTIDLLLATNNVDPQKLRATLTAVGNSSCKDIRVLLVNDSSTPLDGIINGFPITIQVINMGQNVGLTKALKATEKYINAPYIARLDCGDIIAPTRMEKELNYLLNHPICVLVGVATKIKVVDSSHLITEWVSPSSKEIPDLKKQLLYRNPFVHGSIMMRSNAFFKIGGYDQTVRTAQDVDLYLRMRPTGDFFIISEILQTHYFSVGTSITIKKNKISIYYTMRARLKYLQKQELLSAVFLIGFFRDLVLMLLPGGWLYKIRLAVWRRTK